jgi:hypothetical protein
MLLLLLQALTVQAVDGLEGYWKMDSCSGLDSSGNNHNGAVSGDPQCITGHLNQAFEFDGNGDYIDCGTSSRYTLNQFTICAWVYPFSDPDGTLKKGTILSKGHSYSLSIGSSGLPSIAIWIGGHLVIHTEDNIPANDWSYIVGTYDGSALKLYINGTLSKTYKTNKTPEVNARPVYLGFENGGIGSDYFDGRLDEVRLYSRALSAAEIYSLFSGSIGPLVMPHLTGADNGWKDTLTLDNTDPSPALVTVTLYDDAGNSVYSQDHTVAAYGEKVINLKSLYANAINGSVTIPAASQVHCRLAFENITAGGVAEFLLSDATSAKLAFLFSDLPMLRWKGLALTNSGETSGMITFYALGGGQLLGTSAAIPIPSHGKVMGVVSTWFPGLDFHAVKKIIAVSNISTLSGVTIAGDGNSARLLFTAAVPLNSFTVPPGGGTVVDPIVDPVNSGEGYAGTWRGSWTSSHGTSGLLEMELGQIGNRVSGPGSMNTTHCGDLDIPISGVVVDNLVTFDTAFICTAADPIGYGQLTFHQDSWSGNTISGTWREIFNNEVYDTGTFTLTK